MKKLTVTELVFIPTLVALTMVIKMTFATIPGIEFTTPLFIALVVLFKRFTGLLYVLLFLIVDSLILQNGNVVFIAINTIVWLAIFLLCQLVKTIKWQKGRPLFLFTTGFVAVLLQTAIWLFAFPLLSGKAIIFSSEALLAAWAFDFVPTWHPLVAGILAVTIYFALIEFTQTYRLNSVFDKQ